MLFAPAVASASAQGMTMAEHEMQMIEMGHCQSPPAGRADHDKKAGHGCCIAMCMAIAVTASAPAQNAPLRRQIAGFRPPKAYHGVPAEIATPPPRSA